MTEPTKWLADQSTTYVLCNCKGKQAFVKENEKKNEKDEKKKSKSVKFLRYMDEFLSQLMTSHYLKVTSYYIIAKYKARNCCKIWPVIQRCCLKNVAT